MTEKEKELFKNLVSKAFAIDGDNFNSLFNEEGELTDVNTILEADAKRIAKYSNDSRSQYAKGKAEGLAGLEKELLDKYPVDNGDLKGVELIDAIITSKVTEASKLPDDAFEKHPKYAQMKRAHEKELRETKEQAEQALTAKEREFTKKETLNRVKEKVLTQFEGLNPILPDDPQKAANQRKWFLREFEAHEYTIDEQGNVLILDQEGKPKTDEHGHLLKFDDMVKTHASSYFDFKVAQDRSSGGGGGGNPKPPAARKYKFTDYAGFQDELKNSKTPEERSAILNEWKTLNP